MYGGGISVGRINRYLAAHGLSWRWLLWTGTWAGLLFMACNYAWFLGLPMRGMLPSTASAARHDHPIV